MECVCACVRVCVNVCVRVCVCVGVGEVRGSDVESFLRRLVSRYSGELDPTGDAILLHAREVGRLSDKTSYPPCNRAHSRPFLLAGRGHSVQLWGRDTDTRTQSTGVKIMLKNKI